MTQNTRAQAVKVEAQRAVAKPFLELRKLWQNNGVNFCYREQKETEEK